jgi:hypothetical protein
MRRRKIVKFGSVRLVVDKIVALEKDPGEGRVVRIYTGVNVSDDSRASDLKLALGGCYADFLGGGLIGVAVPNR